MFTRRNLMATPFFVKMFPKIFDFSMVFSIFAFIIQWCPFGV